MAAKKKVATKEERAALLKPIEAEYDELRNSWLKVGEPQSAGNDKGLAGKFLCHGDSRTLRLSL